MENSLKLDVSHFSKLEKWSENDKRNIVHKTNSLTVANVVARIEHSQQLGFYLYYESPNLRYTVKTCPIISVEKTIDKAYNNVYIISTRTDTKDTMYYKLTV